MVNGQEEKQSEKGKRGEADPLPQLAQFKLRGKGALPLGEVLSFAHYTNI